MAKMCQKLLMSAFFVIFRLLRGIKTLQKHFYLGEEVLSFDLMGHVKIG